MKKLLFLICFIYSTSEVIAQDIIQSNTTTSNKENNNSSNEHSLTKTTDSIVSSDLESSEYAKTEPEILKLLMWGSIISFTSHLFQEKVNVKTKK